jgi:GNAT superfamily N-acetyltransferase
MRPGVSAETSGAIAYGSRTFGIERRTCRYIRFRSYERERLRRLVFHFVLEQRPGTIIFVADKFKIRALGPADHAQCVALSLDRGWLPARRQWELLLDQAEGFGIDAPDGHGLAGSVTLGRYGALASVGLMLVASRYGRRGLGRALLEHLLGVAQAGTVYLTATSAGRPLYDKLGFRPIRASAQYTGVFVPEPGGRPATRSARQSDLAAILDLDRAAFGADRGFLLRHLTGGFASQLRLLPDRTGYGAAWHTGDVTTIGPVIAPDVTSARSLVTDLAASAAGPVRLDIDPGRPGLADWAAARGLVRAGQTTFMARGPWPPPGDRDRVFAPMSPALG